MIHQLELPNLGGNLAEINRQSDSRDSSDPYLHVRYFSRMPPRLIFQSFPPGQFRLTLMGETILEVRALWGIYLHVITSKAGRQLTRSSKAGLKVARFNPTRKI